MQSHRQKVALWPFGDGSRELRSGPLHAKKRVTKLRPWTATTGEFGPQILTGAPKLSKLGAFTTPGREVALGPLWDGSQEIGS